MKYLKVVEAAKIVAKEIVEGYKLQDESLTDFQSFELGVAEGVLKDAFRQSKKALIDFIENGAINRY